MRFLTLLNLAKCKPSRLLNTRYFSFTPHLCTKEFSDRTLQFLLEDKEFTSINTAALHIRSWGHNIYILQPSMKYKAKSRQSTTANLQLSESIALIETLDKWKVVGYGIYTLKTMGGTKYLYGTGNIEKITQEVKECQATAVFVSIDRLSLSQLDGMQEKFHVPVYDRYSIVLQIFKAHAQSGAAKLQVALAEIPLLRYRKNDSELFKERERSLRAELQVLEQQRKLVKKRRLALDIPTVAVVGYTNAGKTSLIKALTRDDSLKPRNQLFATLDVSVHHGVLSNQMQVLYVDTVGFIADIPTTLIEAFRATLNDALDAHLIIHVCDRSHPDWIVQCKTVIQTLKDLDVSDSKLKSMLTVYNKCDLIDGSQNQITTVQVENTNNDQSQSEDTELLEQKQDSANLIHVSCKEGTGLSNLATLIENNLLVMSDRVTTLFRVLQGGELYNVLLRESDVETTYVDDENPQFLYMKCLFSKVAFAKLKARYGTKYMISANSK
ncbi:unnamed protein product [Didymodactylos carnosus]|uniref:Hflx-type G domain-containing protein n=1 Tax=Didymodactylos carnosus TaxID=1234261 RepID=A0A8S2DRC4_9BILA|nr:unnamed protein product [Didymodactylos carnosus]CAF3728252.1 unnamed protein product [Didymodactylos carnosus]